MNAYVPLSSLEVTNQCVVVCDLAAWKRAESEAWQAIKGTQDDVGRQLAATLEERAIRRLDDFGGVCQTFLCDGEVYRQTPPRIRGSAAVFSFTPKQRLAAEGLEMAEVSHAAGYRLLVLTLQKQDRFGKAWVLCGILRHLAGDPLTYYEDTGSVVDELKVSPESARVHAVHVQAPGYDDRIARLADRVVSQSQYQHEVLAHNEAPNNSIQRPVPRAAADAERRPR
jgi:hypothetical protein